jgi:hypothetical protein
MYAFNRAMPKQLLCIFGLVFLWGCTGEVFQHTAASKPVVQTEEALPPAPVQANPPLAPPPEPPPTPEPISTPDASVGQPAPAVFQGLTSEPVHGSLVNGNTLGLKVRVSGRHVNPGEPLVVQVLQNPDDLTSWVPLALVTSSFTAVAQVVATGSNAAYPFSTEVTPVSNASEVARWPRGGVLRMRVVNRLGVPLAIEGFEDGSATVIGLTNARTKPDSWLYLVENGAGSRAETEEYYRAINAPTTLTAFIAEFGFGRRDEVRARYYNAGDLGIGRDMHCRAISTGKGPGMACYVNNFGTFGDSASQNTAALFNGTAAFATVAMVYRPPIDAPNAVTFYVYGGNGNLLNEAQLDTFGDNVSIPQNCLNCHGGGTGRYDRGTNAVTGARFLPFDPAAFGFGTSTGTRLSDQHESFRKLNALVVASAPTAAVQELVEGAYQQTGGLAQPGSTFTDTYVPPGWQHDAATRAVYLAAIAPYCRGCHAAYQTNAAEDVLSFKTAEGVRKVATTIATRICTPGPHGMPNAEITADAFFSSGARALLLTWLDQPGACSP